MTTLTGSKSRRWTLVALFLLWLFASLGLYYTLQKPFTPAQLAALAAMPWLPLGRSAGAMGSALLDLLTAVWLAFIALGVGLWPLRRLPLPALERTLFGLGLGFGAMGLLVLGLGLAGWLSPAALWTTAVFLTLLALPTAVPHLRRLRPPRPPRLVALYLAVALPLALTLALLPPTSWDGLFYHLTGPKLYLAAGAIRPGIDLPHLNFPSLMEMLFLLAMGLRGDVAATLLHFLFNGMLAGVVYAIARRHLGLPGWTAVLFLYAMPMVLGLATWAYNDLALAFYEAAAVYTFLLAMQPSPPLPRPSAPLLLSGAFCGLAMSLKYTSFVAPLALGLLLLWQYRRRWRDAVRPALAFALPALLIALPWYLKNWAFTGNPFYPFLFDGRFWNEFRALAYADPGTGIGLNLRALAILPASLTIGYDFVTGLQDASQDGLTGPLFLAFLPLLVLYGFRQWRRDGVKRETENVNEPATFHVSRFTHPFHVLLLFALSHYLFWTIGVISSASLWQSRLLLPAFVVLCPALAWIVADLGRFDHPQFSLQRFVRLSLGLVLLLGLAGQLINWLPAQPWAVLTGAESRTAYLQRRLGDHYLAMTTLNETLPPDAAVEFLWEPRTYYCQRDCRPDSILDKLGNLATLHDDADGIAAAWQAGGVSHILLWRTGLDFIIASGTPVDAPLTDLTLLDRLIDRHLTLETAVGGYELYRLNVRQAWDGRFAHPPIMP